jgi:hypothetical protein
LSGLETSPAKQSFAPGRAGIGHIRQFRKNGIAGFVSHLQFGSGNLRLASGMGKQNDPVTFSAVD